MEIDRKFLKKRYVDQQLSTYEIAEELGTYPNKIKRALVKYGIELRSKEESQTVALKHGRQQHPTEGRKRTTAEKIKISESGAIAWKNKPEQTKLKHSEVSRKLWENRSVEDKEEFRKRSQAALRKAARDGSQLEHYLVQGLSRAGVAVEFHRTHLVPNEKLTVDLFLPDCRLVVEVDGPSHYLPIWGDESFQKTIDADAAKNGLLLAAGYTVVRLQIPRKKLSDKQRRDALQYLIDFVKKLPKKRAAKLVNVHIDELT